MYTRSQIEENLAYARARATFEKSWRSHVDYWQKELDKLPLPPAPVASEPAARVSSGGEVEEVISYNAKIANMFFGRIAALLGIHGDFAIDYGTFDIEEAIKALQAERDALAAVGKTAKGGE